MPTSVTDKKSALPSQRMRLDWIRERLKSFSEVRLEEMCDILRISPATARRDFGRLADSGEVERTWGGCAQVQREVMPAFDARKTRCLPEKRAIAKLAAQGVKDGDSVLIDGGTTTACLAEFLAYKRVQVITNSIAVAQKIEQARGLGAGAEVFLTGGRLYPQSNLLLGSQARAMLRPYHTKWLFLSAGGVDEGGVTNHNEEIVEMELAMLEQAKKVVLLADHEKMGRRSLCSLCGWDRVDVLVTDDQSQKWLRKAGLAKQSVNVQIAKL